MIHDRNYLLRTTYDKKRIKVINQLQEYVNENIDDKDEIISALEMLKANEKTDKILLSYIHENY